MFAHPLKETMYEMCQTPQSLIKINPNQKIKMPPCPAQHFSSSEDNHSNEKYTVTHLFT